MAQLTLPTDAPAPEAAAAKQFQSFSEASAFLWSIADLLRGDFKQHDFGKVILPFTVLRRLDCVLEPTKEKVLARHAAMQGGDLKNLDPILNRLTGVHFHNVSKLDFRRLLDDPNHLAANLLAYLKGFSENVREIFLERFKLPEQIAKLDEGNILFLVVKRFTEVDLHPEVVPNHMMGSIFEDLIRRFAEQSNETAGEHFTPREVIRLMVNLLLSRDDEVLRAKGIVKTLYDPACGTGGMLSVAEDYLLALNPDAHLEVFGQELNDESYAICKADMLLKAENPGNVALYSSFSRDGHAGRKFDYMLSNPPFGVEWKKDEAAIKREAETLGFAGRFGAGLPRINDGSFLFLQHMVSKMKPVSEGGSRVAIVFNGSPLFTGDAGSGESEIRRWILENDWLEAIVALPDQLFFNTGIYTYVWLVTNRKDPERKNKVQLINGTDLYQKMRKSLGNKRHELSDEHIAELCRLYGDFEEGPRSKVFDTEDFGFRKITVERPLRLNFQASPERLERLSSERAFEGLAKSKKKGAAATKEIEEGRAQQDALLAMLRTLDPNELVKNRDAFEKRLKAAAKKAGLKLPAPILKALLSALSERDDTADVCKDAKGQPEPDTDLRDTENVPLKEDVDAYVAREVLPHVPDAWVDESKTKIGYEIPFTRHFYEYKPLRPLAEIEAEIRGLEAEIQGMLGEVFS
ncbi:MAG: SAM-dependent DNA methyltransferase [Sandaracinus sp.]|nr:SAM-dependent DNA methyltransferase [Sandaracinus sp.]MCB9616938.1 SAM-dependent DNA methyltransferase [Sandaracinus sp.]